MSFRRLLRIDWDVIAGITAALVAMLLTFMGLVSETVGLGIILLLCALLLTRDLRGEAREHRMFDKLDIIKRHVSDLSAARQADVRLVSPKRMRHEFTEFATMVFGEVRWFNVCCRMFRRPEVFDATLRAFLDNPGVTSITLICRSEEHDFWETDLLPKLRHHPHGKKVHAPLWGSIKGGVSFVLGDVDGDGRNEALLAVMDEPFATANDKGPAVPRFTFRVYNQSELMSPLEEMVRHATTVFETDASERQAAASAHPRVAAPRSAQPPNP